MVAGRDCSSENVLMFGTSRPGIQSAVWRSLRACRPPAEVASQLCHQTVWTRSRCEACSTKTRLCALRCLQQRP